MAYTSAGYTLNLNATETATSADTVNQATTGAQYSNSFTIGAADGNVDRVFNATKVIASSGSPATVNLSTDLATDGVALGILHVVALEVINLDATQTITVKPGASQAIAFMPTAGQALPPGGKLLLLFDSIPGGAAVAGAAVVSGTSDHIDISTGAGTNINCKVTILGRDA